MSNYYKTKIKYLNAFENCKLLHTLEKKKSRIICEFRVDNEDEDLIAVIWYNRKDKKVSEYYYIIDKEIDEHIEFYKKSGHVIKK